MVRISTIGFQREQLESITNVQRSLTERQKQLATGKRVNRVSDDPIASGQIIRLRQEITINETYKENGIQAERHLGFAEGVLGNYTNALTRIKELSVQAGNVATLNAQDREVIALELAGIREEILSLANTQSAQGNFIFAGLRSNERPFIENSIGRVAYVGDEMQRYIQVGPSAQVATSEAGAAMFMEIPTARGSFETRAAPGNAGGGVITPGQIVDLPTWETAVDEGRNFRIVFNPLSPGINYSVEDEANPGVPLPGLNNIPYIPGSDIVVSGIRFSITGTPQPGDAFELDQPGNQDIFSLLDNAIVSLNSQTTNERISYDMNLLNQGSDNAVGHVANARAVIGGRLNLIETQRTLMLDLELIANETLSEIESADLTELVSQIAGLSLNLEAIQRSFVKTQELNLFRFIS